MWLRASKSLNFVASSKQSIRRHFSNVAASANISDPNPNPDGAGFASPEQQELDVVVKKVKNIVKGALDAQGRGYATGRRKTSSARVFLTPGSGLITVNGKRFIDYFQTTNRITVLNPFIATGTAGLYDAYITVRGGGTSGQAGAIRLGISRALLLFNPNHRPNLRAEGYLTRDSRRVERKKPGQKKARKKFQWVKR